MSRFWRAAICFWLFGNLCAVAVETNLHTRADLAIQSFLLKFWDGNGQYLNHKFPNDGQHTGYWTYANGWEAVLDAIERTNKREYFGWIENFYLGQNERGWDAAWYDDLCWMTLALIRSYDLTGDAKYLNQAATTFAPVPQAWDTTCCGAVKGGVWWDAAHTSKATASNAGAALASAKLYRRTNNSTYLDFARQVYSFWYANMVDPSTGQVCDHINPSGEKVWWRFTYNEGLMIGAALELSESGVANASTYLPQANFIANYTRDQEVISTIYGNVLHDGGNTECGGDCHQFKGPSYRALMRLYNKTSRADIGSLLHTSADGVWNLARNSNLNIFATSWAGPSLDSVEMMEQNSAATALSQYAQHTQTYINTKPQNQFEAENAVIHHIPLESIYAGFEGWGYLAAWNRTDQWVDFPVTFGAPATCGLTFRYSAGAGNARRTIQINGANVFPNALFTNTGSWTSYSDLVLTNSFPAGKSVISVKYDSGLGSVNFLNLDYLRISNYTPPALGPLTALVQRPNVVLTWTSPGALQSATAAVGPWTDVTGNPASPATLPFVTSGARFYRLRN